MKSILIGSVHSSEIVLREMIKLGFPLEMVFSLDDQYAKNVSGYVPLHDIAEAHGIPFKKFRKIGSEDNIQLIKEIAPDYIFVIGLSQLINKDILNCAKIGVVGFHPTPLPKFRGRAAMVWQVLLGVHETKCSLFMIDEGVDSGDILGQEEYVIEDTDYASDVSRKLGEALSRLMPKVLGKILNGNLELVRQKEEDATYLLIRRPEDGRIDWNAPVEKIQRLIRAVSKPYPGAFSLYDGAHKIIIWRADYLENKKYIGIPGQICEIHDDYIDVVGADGIIRIQDYENIDGIRMLVGHKLK